MNDFSFYSVVESLKPFIKYCLRNNNDATLYLALLGCFIRGERKNSFERKGVVYLGHKRGTGKEFW